MEELHRQAAGEFEQIRRFVASHQFEVRQGMFNDRVCTFADIPVEEVSIWTRPHTAETLHVSIDGIVGKSAWQKVQSVETRLFRKEENL